MWKEIQGWKEKLLSIAGREILIKVVIQAIPIYTMSCFKILKCLIKVLEVLIRKFWWGYNDATKKVHWVSWERLCEAKELGGMGFKEIEKFNEAFLAKQVWRMMQNPESLCFGVFKSRFFPNYSILEAKESNSGSYTWKRILSARDVIRKGMVWCIGDGQTVPIKEDKWLSVKPSRLILSPLPLVVAEARVSSLINPDLSMWKSEEVNRLFLPHEASLVLGISLSHRKPSDRVSWSCTPSGEFSTCSAYKLLATPTLTNRTSSSNQDYQRSSRKGFGSCRYPTR